MEKEQLLEELVNLIEHLAITIKYDRGNFKGGLVRYHDDNLYYMNRKADTDEKIQTIINELKQVQIPEELLSEEIRKAFPELMETMVYEN